MTDSPLQQLYRILDRLDYENDDRVRADLIDAAIDLADHSAACALEWRNYR